MGRGKLKRLKKRYGQYDREKFLYLLPLIPFFFVFLLIPGYLLRLSGYTLHISGSLSFTISIAWLILDLIVMWLLLIKIIDQLTQKYDLRCTQCGRPLDRMPILIGRRIASHPDYRNDGDVPKRCPHCKIPIEEATRHAPESSKSAQRVASSTDNF